MVGFTSQISIILLLFLCATTFHRSMSSNHGVVRCNEKDRRTLLIFKRGVIDPFNILSTWSSEKDCCAWIGVQCDNTTGRVTKLGLNSDYRSDYPWESLRGEINLSLLELEFLNYLDLSYNMFEAVSIPPISDNITPATSLRYLDLSFNNYHLHMDNLHWISRLSSLKYLNLSFIDLHKETNWLQLVATLPSLSELRLSECQLSNISPSLKYVNFNSLVTLDLSWNHFDSKLPYWLFNLSSDISHLDLGGNSLHGEIPSSLLNLRNLKYLDLSWNRFKGSIPDWLGQHDHLQHLDLSHNLFYGTIPSTIGNLSSLVDFDIRSNLLRGNLPNSIGQLFNLKSLHMGNNSWSGVLSETLFSKLSNLEDLDLSNSAFAFDFDPEWIPSFQLRDLYLSNTSQGPNFPPWIYTQKSLETLYISRSGISFVDGDMFRSLVAGIMMNLDLSYNSISVDISNVTLNSFYLMLGHNNFTGGLPHISANASFVDVSHNSFSGSIPRGLENWKYLLYINLWSNRLSGEVPLDLSNLKQLKFMNLGKNEFSGNIPNMIPQNLEVLILRSNHFAGNIPPQLCNLTTLYHLDLAHNKLSGSIPHCVYNITAMVADNVGFITYMESNKMIFDLFTKGQHYEYEFKGQWRIIDLSANNLSGEIPVELFRLIEVQTLNLSHNHLTGAIPKAIGDMKNLESLDLSNNQLYGEIPQSMTVLSFLDYLNLSCNNMSGQIPIGTQLQSFNASSYIGNPELCGAPLTKNCTEEEKPGNAKQQAGNEDGDPERESLYLGMGVGFAVGFWGICGSLFLNRAWRHTYFRFLDQVVDRIYLTLMVKFNSLRNMEARVR